MMVLVTYDVNTTTAEGRRRLAHAAKTCVGFGQRVQNSVFECEVDPARFVMLKSRLVKIIDPARDSLRFYFLGSNWQRRVEHVGARPAVDLHGALIT